MIQARENKRKWQSSKEEERFSHILGETTGKSDWVVMEIKEER